MFIQPAWWFLQGELARTVTGERAYVQSRDLRTSLPDHAFKLPSRPYQEFTPSRFFPLNTSTERPEIVSLGVV